MTDMEAKITITVDPAGKMHRVEVEGSTISIIRTLEPYLTAWLNTVNDCRQPGVSDTKITQQLFDTVARRVIDAYGESVLLPVLFNLACKYRGETTLPLWKQNAQSWKRWRRTIPGALRFPR